MKLSTRTINALRGGVDRSIIGWDGTNPPPKGAIARLTYKEVNDIPNLGKRSLQEIVDWLQQDGMTLSESPPKAVSIETAIAVCRSNGFDVFPAGIMASADMQNAQNQALINELRRQAESWRQLWLKATTDPENPSPTASEK